MRTTFHLPSSVAVNSPSPLVIEVRGTLTLSAGPLPNTPFDYVTKWTFSGAHPEAGQVTTWATEVTGISKGTSASAPTPSSGASSTGPSMASLAGMALPTIDPSKFIL